VQFAAKLGILEDVVLDDVPLLLPAKLIQCGPQHHVVLVVGTLDRHVSQLHSVHLCPFGVELLDGAVSLGLRHVYKQYEYVVYGYNLYAFQLVIRQFLIRPVVGLEGVGGVLPLFQRDHTPGFLFQFPEGAPKGIAYLPLPAPPCYEDPIFESSIPDREEPRMTSRNAYRNGDGFMPFLMQEVIHGPLDNNGEIYSSLSATPSSTVGGAGGG